MVPSGYEADVIGWGRRLFDDDSVFNSGYYGEMTTVDDHYPGNYYRDHYNLEHNSVENDEIIARTLQENLSQLSITDSSRYPVEREEPLQGSMYTIGWHNSFPRNNNSGIHYAFLFQCSSLNCIAYMFVLDDILSSYCREYFFS